MLIETIGFLFFTFGMGMEQIRNVMLESTVIFFIVDNWSFEERSISDVLKNVKFLKNRSEKFYGVFGESFSYRWFFPTIPPLFKDERIIV